MLAERLAEVGLISQWDYFRTILDVGIVAYIVYKLFSFIRGTRAVPLINGLFILIVGYLFAKQLDLYTIQWILENAFVAASVAIPIIFQPELRRALEHLGRGKLLPTGNRQGEDLKGEELRRLIDQVVRAAEILGRTKTGALVVLERETGLGEYIDSGIALDAVVTWELLTNIFVEKTPLHDGAVIIRANRAAAAACWLPLAEASVLSHELGTRHRAGVGVTEQSDAVTVIVSEETGAISVAQGGKLIRHLDEKTLREMLTSLLEANKPAGNRGFWNWGAAS
ncbi:MAG TPA: diadenylate cyclase CdaA [Symbiobacteriaceae bacterium]|nr:diadenylate cyclase CdaA [Symbiobacteriaceae bacterium]